MVIHGVLQTAGRRQLVKPGSWVGPRIQCRASVHHTPRSLKLPSSTPRLHHPLANPIRRVPHPDWRGPDESDNGG